MSGLLYKNFRINFSSFLLALIVTLISCAITIAASILDGTDLITEDDGAMLFFVLYYFGFMMPSLSSSLLFEADESKTASAFAMSLPQGGKGHIEAKYWYILIQYLLVLFITFLTDTVTYVILGGTFSAAILLVFIFSWRLLLSAIEIPFIIRFGSQKGVSIKGLVTAFIAMLAIVYLMFGDISWLINSDKPLKAFMEWLESGRILFLISLFPFISCAAYYLSCKISIKVFRKGAENYEQ